MKIKQIVSALLLASSVFCFAEENKQSEENETPKKICLLVTDVGTIDTVAKTEEFLTQIKQFNVDEVPRLSEADKVVNPELARHEINVRFNDNMRKYNESEREIADRNRRMERVLEQLRNSIVGNEHKRDIVVAKNYLQSYLQPYSESIQVIDRANTSLAEVEKAIGSKEQQEVASACKFLTVIMQDMKQQSTTVQVGNTMVKRTTYTQKAVSNVRDFNGNVVFSCNVVATTNRRTTSASKSSGFNPSSDLMEQVLKQIAEKVANNFICTLNVEVIGPKDDEAFDEDEVSLTLDGQEFESGSSTLIGTHTLIAEAEGYKPITKELTLSKGGTRKIKLRFTPRPKAAAEISCPHCGKSVVAGSTFCPGCGKSIKTQKEEENFIACDKCGTKSRKGTKFCPNCGDVFNCCPHCRANNPANAVICISCGKKMPVKCPNCGAMAAGSMKFCSECGTTLQKQCPNCKEQLEGNIKFCSSCGTKIN